MQLVGGGEVMDEVPSILEDVKKIPLYFFYLSNILLGRDVCILQVQEMAGRQHSTNINECLHVSHSLP